VPIQSAFAEEGQKSKNFWDVVDVAVDGRWGKGMVESLQQRLRRGLEIAGCRFVKVAALNMRVSMSSGGNHSDHEGQ
jgi:hypothetical protein